QEGSQVQSSTYNAINQLTGISGGSGQIRLQGETDKFAQVHIGNQVITTDVNNLFSAQVPVQNGLNTINIKLTTPAGEKTRQVQFNVSGSGNATLSYDDNGNLLSDGTRSYQWDSANHLKKITQGTHESDLAYDGSGHIIHIEEKEAGVVTSSKDLLWLGERIV